MNWAVEAVSVTSCPKRLRTAARSFRESGSLAMTVSSIAAIVQLGTLRDDEDWLLLGIDVVIIVAAVWVAVEAVLAMRAARSMPEETDAHDREAAAPESATR